MLYPDTEESTRQPATTLPRKLLEFVKFDVKSDVKKNLIIIVVYEGSGYASAINKVYLSLIQL